MNEASTRAEWTLVRPKSAGLLDSSPTYAYARIAGGWLVTTFHPVGGVTFIPDPEHRTPPLPQER